MSRCKSRGGAGLRVFICVLAVTAAGVAPAEAQDTDDSCIGCHGALTGPLAEPVEAFQEDVHAHAGFGCAACHGGDPTVAGMSAMDPASGFLGIPKPAEIPQVCGRCHSNAEFMRHYNPGLRVDQVAEYVTSVHGQRLLGAGDTAVATCASCHGTHGILRAADTRSRVYPLNVSHTCGECHADPEHMAVYGIPTDQREKYERSIHWKTMSEDGDTSAPTCNDCHGNHGAAPPGVSWVGNVCGQCHVVMSDYFNGSRHAEVFGQLGIPGCAACHQNHEIRVTGDAMLGLEEGAVCARCHRSEDPGGQAAVEMASTIAELRVELDSARIVLDHAEDAGMEVSEALVSLHDAQSALVKARTAVHSFQPDTVRASVEPGHAIAGEALAEGLEALDDLHTRRLGLAISVLIIAALIAGLILKIREQGSGSGGRGETAIPQE